MNLKLKVTTKTNLYIGGTPQTFEIGGTDMQTVTENGRPYIPASSFKGALREIVKTQPDAGITRLYKKYLKRDKAEFIKNIQNRDIFEDDKTKYIDAYKEIKENVSPEYIFGIPAFNHAPKLLFNDLFLTNPLDANEWFSIDMKNSIEEKKGNLEANPRTYKVARGGLTFWGNIAFYQFNKLGEGSEKTVEAYLKKCLAIFNDGVFRIGNSKSRGYGWIEVAVADSGE